MHIEAYLLCAVFAAVWIYVLTVFRRRNMNAFLFIVGTLGTFLLSFVLFMDIVTVICAKCLEYILLALSHIFSFYSVYPVHNIVFVTSQGSAISLFVDYECSGAIEFLVLMSVTLFFPKLSLIRRIIYVAIGFIYTMMANAIRVIVIAWTINRLGSNAYYAAHSIAGRVVFYVLTIILYFYLFTWQQIKTQITGRFAYGDNSQKQS